MTQNSDSPDTSDQHAVDQSQQSSLEETCRFHPAGRTCIYCGLSKVPRHVMINILKFLEIEDVFALGITCKGFRYLITDEEVGCQVLQVRQPS
jgi:hypothetical protein